MFSLAGGVPTNTSPSARNAPARIGLVRDDRVRYAGSAISIGPHSDISQVRPASRVHSACASLKYRDASFDRNRLRGMRGGDFRRRRTTCNDRDIDEPSHSPGQPISVSGERMVSASKTRPRFLRRGVHQTHGYGWGTATNSSSSRSAASRSACADLSRRTALTAVSDDEDRVSVIGGAAPRRYELWARTSASRTPGAPRVEGPPASSWRVQLGPGVELLGALAGFVDAPDATLADTARPLDARPSSFPRRLRP